MESRQHGLLANVKAEFDRRKFSAGLMMAFIDFVDELGEVGAAYEDAEALFADYPPLEKTAAGKSVNTLTLELETRQVKLRPLYNKVERQIRSGDKRFDYPSCAPHATQAWRDYRPWLSSLLAMTRGERAKLRRWIHEFVLTSLPSHEFDPKSVVKEPPLFTMLLSRFDFAARKGERSGAAYQGLTFGFMRADNPHLQVEVRKVRTGGKRKKGIGDIDAWDGKNLAATAEVKQLEVDEKKFHELIPFIGEGGRRGAITMVVALRFAEGIRDKIEELGAIPLSVGDLLRISRMWDSQKQKIAVASFEYYVFQVEKNSALGSRFEQFITGCRDQWAARFDGDM